MVSSTKCPCGLDSTYDNCCGLYISGKKQAPTAEALMRSRYSAYVKQKVEYVGETHDPKSAHDFNIDAAKAWSENTDWQGLEIVRTEHGGAEDESGLVEFIARFHIKGAKNAEEHHEISLFRHDLEAGRWYYVDGKTVLKPFVRAEPKTGRNDPCHCGSGKKFKKCCGLAA